MAISVTEANTVSNHGFDALVEQQIYAKSAVLTRLKQMQKVNTGGYDLRTNIRYAKLGRSGSVDPEAQIVFSKSTTRTAAVFNRAYYEGDTVITMKERAENYGKGQIVNLIKDKTQELSEDFYNAFATDLYTAATSANPVTSLSAIVGSASLGGIAAADVATWKAATLASTTLSLACVGTAVAGATFGTDKPTMHITTLNLWDKFNRLMVSNVRYEDKAMANAGFDNIKWYSAPVIGDQLCPASTWYGLDMNALELRVDPAFNFKITQWMDLDVAGYPNSLGKVMTFAGQLVTNMRQTCFKFTALDYTN